jgi:hypothetical protein
VIFTRPVIVTLLIVAAFVLIVWKLNKWHRESFSDTDYTDFEDFTDSNDFED